MRRLHYYALTARAACKQRTRVCHVCSRTRCGRMRGRVLQHVPRVCCSGMHVYQEGQQLACPCTDATSHDCKSCNA